MSKDNRIYGRFTVDFPDSPKIEPLSDAAFRTLVEMTLYSRRLLTDGWISEAVAKKRWKAAAIKELLNNDSLNPSLSWDKDIGCYIIHDYADHQQTKADIEKYRKAGSKGGIAKAKGVANATETLKQKPSESSSKTLAITETETETETEIDVNNLSNQLKYLNAKQSVLDDLRAKCGVDSGLQLVRNLKRFANITIDEAGALELALELSLAASGLPVVNPAAYATTLAKNDPAEVQKFAYQLDLIEVVA